MVVAAINSSAVSAVRYGSGIIEWTKQELQSLDRKTRKMVTMYGAHHSKVDINMLYVRRSRGDGRLISLEDCVEMEESSLGKYSMSTEELLKSVKDFDDQRRRKEAREKEEIQKKHENSYESKALHKLFERET